MGQNRSQEVTAKEEGELPISASGMAKTPGAQASVGTEVVGLGGVRRRVVGLRVVGVVLRKRGIRIGRVLTRKMVVHTT